MDLPFVLLLLLAAGAGVSMAADIPPGSTLYASDVNSMWASPNSTFAVKFVADPDGALAAVVAYGNFSIWRAGGSSVSASPSAVLRLLSSGDLQLLPSSAADAAPIWSSGTAGIGVNAASLEESGELILKNSSGSVLWSTFNNPTDAVVPGQTFNTSHTLSAGSYAFRIERNGNLTLRWNGTVVYFNSGLNSSGNSNLTSPNLQIQRTGALTLSDPLLSSPLTLAYNSDYGAEGDILRFLKLDGDGNLRMYSSLRGGDGNVNMGWAALSDQCQVYGYCGNMGICSYNESLPVCGCPSQNFELNNSSDPKQGCKRKVELQNCPGNATMLELDHSIFHTYQPEITSQLFYQGISPCRSNCLNGPCIASTALADGSGVCYLKTDGFVSGYQSPALPSTSFVKVCSPAIPNSAPNSDVSGRTRWRVPAWLVAVVVLVTILGLVAIEGSLWWWCLKNSPKFGGLSSQYALLEYASGAPVQFSYKELHKATKGFKEKLGAGGFGTVYRGVLANRTVAAVKQLEGIEQGEKQFRMEVATISSTHHLNLVRLIGFCSEGRHRLLVYEFMKNSSLDTFLFTASEDQSGKHLNWEHRYNIALGTARGIMYLHEECRDCIVHCDIKPENILLDDNYHAKVSDFGLAKLVNPKDHRYRTLTSVRGTRGYLAPEWLANLPITSKSDIYSYGMVLLEILSGRRNFEVSSETNHKKFSVWAYEEFEKGNVEAVVDRRLDRSEINMEQVVRAVEVSFWCIQEQPSQRPMMGKVVQMLEGIIEIERPPAPNVASVEGSIGGTSILTTSSASALSTFAASMPVPSSSSSLLNAGAPLGEPASSEAK